MALPDFWVFNELMTTYFLALSIISFNIYISDCLVILFQIKNLKSQTVFTVERLGLGRWTICWSLEMTWSTKEPMLIEEKIVMVS